METIVIRRVMRGGLLEGHFFLSLNFLAELNGIWDHSSLTRGQNHTPPPPPRKWQHRILTMGPPGKSLEGHFSICMLFTWNLYLIIIALHTLCTSMSMYYIRKFKVFKILGTSPVVQWLRICLSILGTWILSLLQEDPTCWAAAKPVCHT